MKNLRLFENLAKILSIVSFVLICLLAHRVLMGRPQCVSSSFISFVQIGSERIENCRYESRLSVRRLFAPLAKEALTSIRQLEVIEPLTAMFSDTKTHLAVDLSETQPRAFEIGAGYIRLGRDWLIEPEAVRRALIMGVLRHVQPAAYGDSFQREVMADFLLLALFSVPENTNLTFGTSAATFADYCRSPLRSPFHFLECAVAKPQGEEKWGLRPLLSLALWKMFERASLAQKLESLNLVRNGAAFTSPTSPVNNSAEALALWFQAALQAELQVLHLDRDESARKAVVKKLQVETPLRWELTVDLTNTPAWREIVDQFRKRSRFRPLERTLIFTPEGGLALPSGLPVGWKRNEIQSQKHVMIACQWPRPDRAITVTARHVYARQSCSKVEEVFWN